MANNITCHDFPCYLASQLTSAITDPSLNPKACFLSPRAKFQGATLTAFTGSVVTGITSGFDAVFFVGWTAWFPILRISLVGIWELYEAILLRPLKGGHQYLDLWRIFEFARGFESNFFRQHKEQSVTFLGCFGWLYSAVWSPTREILWLIENWETSSASLKIVRALGVAVAGIPLTIDTRNRYGELLGKVLGTWARCIFNLITATSCMTLGIISAMLMGLAVQQAEIKWYFVLIYVVLSLIWGFAGMSFMVPHDDSESRYSFGRIIGGIFIGCFSGCFLAAPAFILSYTAQTFPGVGVLDYVECKSVTTWRKVVALSP
jgi:hypothetical protein